MPSTAWHWASDQQFPSFCLIFARSKSAESVLEAYGANAQAATELTRKESLSAFPRRKVAALLRVGSLNGWTFCYEDRELFGITGDVRKSMSHGCETLSLYKGGDGTRTFERMKNCRSIEFFEPHRPSEAYGEGPYTISGLVQEKLSAAGPNTLGMSAITLVLAEQFSLELDRDILEGPLLTAPLQSR
ncbi:DUF6461 domain-containing protein [Streptomyces sp. MMBL 11-3]|uniref:DUF6461 domain-containing protein n=1 Tax=Streptomyces sp. MMBL 11-3 TaxID=3382639 RepID=UPI0039B37ECA